MQKFDFKFINAHLDGPERQLIEFIAPITEEDSKIFDEFTTPSTENTSEDLNCNFEDSFEYIRMYFNSGRFQGFKYYDQDNLLFFASEKKNKPHFKVFKPLGSNPGNALVELINFLSKISKYPIQFTCLSNDQIKVLKTNTKLKIRNIKEFNYYIYDLASLGDLHGNRWKNVRQKIRAFNREYPKLKFERLSTMNYNETIHFIGSWRKQLLDQRGYSYSNLEKNKFAAKFYSDNSDFKNIWAMVYKLSGRLVAFQLLYRLGANSAAHAIGLADTEIRNLSEFTQMHIWSEVKRAGIRYINDGASWRIGLEKYKQKFNPISCQKIFECKIRGSGL